MGKQGEKLGQTKKGTRSGETKAVLKYRSVIIRVCTGMYRLID